MKPPFGVPRSSALYSPQACIKSGFGPNFCPQKVTSLLSFLIAGPLKEAGFPLLPYQ